MWFGNNDQESSACSLPHFFRPEGLFFRYDVSVSKLCPNISYVLKNLEPQEIIFQ